MADRGTMSNLLMQSPDGIDLLALQNPVRTFELIELESKQTYK